MKKADAPASAAHGSGEWGGSGVAFAASGTLWGQEPAEPSAAAPRPAAGHSRLGRYRVRGELGRGGMGQVMVAWDDLLGRTVALKRVLPARASHHQATARLAREARITGMLEHPAIVPVLDAGYDASGEPFYVMRLIRGRTLAAAAAEADGLAGRLRLLRHFLQTCEAIAFAHKTGVVHRDLKADNVLVGEFGETQVADWGLARELQPGDVVDVDADADVGADVDIDAFAASSALSGPAAGAESPGQTRAGAIVGTPAFMSPEQAAGQPAGVVSDVYSLGVMLWQLLVGEPPYLGLASAEVLRRVAAGALPGVWGVLPEAPPELVAIVARATAPAPTDRYADARALAADVERYLEGRRVSAYAYSPREQLLRVARAWRAPLTVAAVAVVLLLVVGVVQFQRTARERDRAVAAEQQAGRARVAADKSLSSSLAQHALAAMAIGRRDLAETFAAGSVARAPSPDARGVLAAYGWAPRAQRLPSLPLPACQRVRVGARNLVCVERGAVSAWRWTGQGYERRWRRRGGARDAALFERANAVVLLDRDQRVVALRSGHETQGARLPTGALRVEQATVRGTALAADSTVAVPLRADGAAVTPLRCPQGGAISVSTKAPGSARVAVICERGEQMIVADGPARPLVNLTVDVAPHRGATAAAWLPGGVTVVVGARDGSLLHVDTRARTTRPLGGVPGGQIDSLLVAPHGRTVAVATEAGGVFVWHLAGGTVQARIPAQHAKAMVWRAVGAELWTFGERLQRWRLPPAPRAVQLWGHHGRHGLGTARLSPDAARVALAPGSGELQVLDTATGALEYSHRFNPAVLKGVAWRDDSRLLAWSAAAPSVRIYRAGPWRPGRARGAFGVKRALWMADDAIVFAPFADGLYVVPAGDERVPARPLPSARGREAGVFIDADQPDHRRWALAVRSSGAAWRITARDGELPVAAPIPGVRGVRRVAVSGDGRLVAWARPERIAVWHWPSQRQRAQISVGASRFYGIDLDGTGALLAAGLRDGSARVWRTTDGRHLATLRGHQVRVADVHFHPGGQVLLTASWDGSARLWHVPTLTAPREQLTAAVQTAWSLDTARALQALRP